MHLFQFTRHSKGFQVLAGQAISIGDSANELGMKDFSLDYLGHSLGHESTGFTRPIHRPWNHKQKGTISCRCRCDGMLLMRR